MAFERLSISELVQGIRDTDQALIRASGYVQHTLQAEQAAGSPPSQCGIRPCGMVPPTSPHPPPAVSMNGSDLNRLPDCQSAAPAL